MADALAHLKQWVNIDKQKSADELSKNAEYNINTWDWFKDWKDNWWGLPFWKFEDPSSSNNKEEINDSDNDIDENIESKNSSKVEENPNTPLIDWFILQWKLNNNEWVLIKNSLIERWDVYDNIMKIKWINVNKLKEVVSSIQYLKGSEAKSINSENFNKDFQDEIDLFKENVKWWKKWEKELVWRNKELVEMLWWNYLNLPNKDWWKEVKKNVLNRSLKTTLNTLMNWKSFKRTDWFDTMFKRVNNSSLSFKERFTQLKKIDTFINNDQSRAIWKSLKSYNNNVNWLENQKLTLNEKFVDFKENLKKSKEGKEKEILKDLLIIANDLIDEAEESWDIFIASELDLLKDELKEELWEQV